MKNRCLSLLAPFLAILVGCVTAPYTGRSQFIIVSEADEARLGEEAYRYTMRESVITTDPEALRIVRKVGERIAQAANKPDYRWDFKVVNDPEMVNAFALPGGKVAVYSGIFPAARDEAGLAVVIGHEVAHALLRHGAERMSQTTLLQLGGAVLSGVLGSHPQVLQAYGLGAGLGLILPFSRSQETEADRIGLILMAKAGYDPRVSLEVWERMEKLDSGRQAPPEFLSTHPGYETRVQQLRQFIPEALTYYRPVGERLESLPSPQSLDTSTARMERELLKRIQLINRQAEDPQGERAVAEAIGSNFRINASTVAQERQQLQLGYGQYAALRALASTGRASLRSVFNDYQSGLGWSELSRRYGASLNDLIGWVGELRRTAATVQNQLRYRPPSLRYRAR